MRAAFATEIMKLRYSRIPAITLAAATIGVGVGGLFMFISINPDRARSLGLLGTKAQLVALDPTWAGYLSLLAQIIAVGGVLIFGMTMLWIFGREFADRTAKDLLALPTSRTAIVTAKFAAAVGWCLVLTAYITVLGTLIGAGLGLDGWNTMTATHGIIRIVVSALLTISLTTSFGLAASVGRGYLPGVLALFTALFTAQILAALGYGNWYPYSVPALYSGIGGPDQPAPSLPGHLAVITVAALSITATIGWWRTTDHTR